MQEEREKIISKMFKSMGQVITTTSVRVPVRLQGFRRPFTSKTIGAEFCGGQNFIAITRIAAKE